MPKWVFYCSCPACPPGFDNQPSSWTHTICGTTMYVWDDCDLGCTNCCCYHHILDWRFICNNHRTEAREPNIHCLLRAISALAQMQNIPYKTWKSMEKRIEEEGIKRGINLDDD